MEPNSEDRTPLSYLIFLLMSYILTGLMLLLLAFLLYRFQISSNALEIGIIVTYVLSTFLGGFLAGKKAKTRKFLWGLLMGAGYYLILAVFSLLSGTGQPGASFLTCMIICCGGGMLGGMLS